MKNGDDVLRDIRKLNDEMGEFLAENREANESRKFPPVGPAARSIGEALRGLLSTWRRIVHPDEYPVQVEVRHKIEYCADRTRARLAVETLVDGKTVGINTVMYGTKQEVEAYERRLMFREEFEPG